MERKDNQFKGFILTEEIAIKANRNNKIKTIQFQAKNKGNVDFYKLNN